MGTKYETILKKSCDYCGRLVNTVYRCIGCGAEHCTWCVGLHDTKYDILHVNTSAQNCGGCIYICEKCKADPPQSISAIYRIALELAAFDKESDERVENRVKERERIVDEAGAIKDINCIVCVENGKYKNEFFFQNRS